MTINSLLGNQSVTPLVTAIKTTVTVSSAVAQQQAATTQSTAVSLGQATPSTPVYTISRPALVWERSSSDLLSSKLAGNFSAAGNVARFAGLGSALMERFANNGGNYSQSVI